MYMTEGFIRSVVYIGYAEGDSRVYTASGFLVRLDRPNAPDPAS